MKRDKVARRVSERWPDKTIIGLTGNIATGKSVVRRMLEHLGAFSIDADALAHRAMSPGAPAYQPVVEMFGRWVTGQDGQIDRRRLGQIVFADPAALAALERITHPIVKEVIDLLIRRARQPVVVIEAIKLIEAGLADDCDAVWVVDAPPDAQFQRLVEGRGLGEAEARYRMEIQNPQAEKAARATLVIDNGGAVQETFEQVRQAFNRLAGVHEAAAEAAPPATALAGEVTIRRGTLRHAGDIARFISRVRGETLDRNEILLRFGQKAYMLAYVGDKIAGLAGWQVENLITRVDELVLAPGAPVGQIVPRLVSRVEEASGDLQSEVALLFLGRDVPDGVEQAALEAGYEVKTAAELRVPDWREAALESAPPDSTMVFKRLRADRVLKPI